MPFAFVRIPMVFGFVAAVGCCLFSLSVCVTLECPYIDVALSLSLRALKKCDDAIGNWKQKSRLFRVSVKKIRGVKPLFSLSSKKNASSSEPSFLPSEHTRTSYDTHHHRT
jgi:hypothetical protein